MYFHISDTGQAGESEFPCILFFGSRREKLEGKINKMSRGVEAVSSAFAEAGRRQQC